MKNLAYKASLDIDQAKKAALELQKIFKEVGISGSKGFETKPITEYQKAQLKMQEVLRDARLEIEKLKIANQQYRNEVEQGKVSQQSAKTTIEQLKVSEQQLRISIQESILAKRQDTEALNKNKLAQSELKTQLDQGKLSSQNYKNEVDRLKISEQELSNQLQKAKVDLQQHNEQLIKNRATQSASNTALNESKTATQEARTALIKYTLEQKQLSAATRAARAANVAVAGSYKEAQQQLTALGNRIRNVEGGFNGLGKVQRARIKEYNELNNKLKAFDSQLGNHQRNVGNYKSALSGVKGELVGMIGQYLSLAAVIGGVGATLNQSLKSDAVRTSLEFTFGSVDLADAKLKQLLETANRLGVDYNALTSSYKSFTGAVIASNFDFATGERIFNAVAGASAKLKLSAEDTEGALRALQQMISKGNVQAEELRGQLGERIPGAFSIAARAMGVTETQLNKMLERGEVLAADLLPKLANELEKTFDTKSEERVEGLAAAWGRLTNVFSGTVGQSGRITAFFTALIDGVGRASQSIVNMVNSSSWNEFVARLLVNDDGKTGDNIRSITDAVEKSQKVIDKSYNVGAGSPAKTIITTYEEVKIAYEQANKALTIFKEGVASGKLVEKGKSNIQSLSSTVISLGAEMNRLKFNLPENTNKAPTKTAKQIKEDEAATKKAQAAREKAQRDREQQDKKAIGNAESLSKRLTEVHNASFRKTISDDEAEIQAVKDKYAKLKEEADKYYKDPKNNKAVKINGKNVSRSEVYGMMKADAKNEEEAILEKRREKAREIEKKKYEELLKEFMDYGQKREALTKEFNEDAASLANDPRQLAVRTKAYNDDLAELDKANSTKLEKYEALFKGIEELSIKNALKQVDIARKQFAKDVIAGTITDPAELEKIKKYLDEIEQTIREKSGKALQQLGSDISGLASSVGEVNKEFGEMLNVVGNVVGKVGDIKAGLKDFKTAGSKGDTLGQLGAGLGIVGAGISIFSSVFKMFDRSQEREEQAAYGRDLQGKQTEALNKALERQVALLDQAYGTEKIDKYNLAITQARENEAKYQKQLQGRLQLTGYKDADKLIEQINAGKTTGYGAYQAAVGALIKQGAKLPTELEALQRLADEGKLDAGTKLIVDNLIQATKQAEELKNALTAEKVGFSLGQLADDFISTLTDGTQDFGKTFEETIQKSILNGFKGQLIQKQLKAFYEQFDKLSEGGLTKDEIEVLRLSYLSASEKAKQDLEALSKATGIDLSGKTSSTTPSNTAQTGIVRTQLTEQTGQRIDGIMRAHYDATKQTNNLLIPIGKVSNDLFAIAKSNFDVVVRVEANTLRTANNTDLLNTKLDAIINNTKQPIVRGLP